MDTHARQGEKKRRRNAGREGPREGGRPLKITPVLLSVCLFAVGEEHERERDRRRIQSNF